MKFITTYLPFFFPLLTIGQIKLINIDLINKDLNQLYIGMDNRLQIVGQKNVRGYKLTSVKSSVLVNDSCFVLTPEHRGVDTVKIFKGNKLIYCALFNLFSINEPTGQLAFTYDTTITLNRILANPYLSIKIPNCNYNFLFSINGFQCSILQKNKDKETFANTLGCKLTNDMLTLINRLKTGDVIEFERIKYGISPEFCPRMLGPLRITIK